MEQQLHLIDYGFLLESFNQFSEEINLEQELKDEIRNIFENTKLFQNEKIISNKILIKRIFIYASNRNIDFKFKKGLNVIDFPNLYGKSTLLNLISWGLTCNTKFKQKISDDVFSLLKLLLLEIKFEKRSLTITIETGQKSNYFLIGKKINYLITPRLFPLPDQILNYSTVIELIKKDPNLIESSKDLIAQRLIQYMNYNPVIIPNNNKRIEGEIRSIPFVEYYNILYANQETAYYNIFHFNRQIRNALIGELFNDISKKNIRSIEIELNKMTEKIKQKDTILKYEKSKYDKLIKKVNIEDKNYLKKLDSFEKTLKNRLNNLNIELETLQKDFKNNAEKQKLNKELESKIKNFDQNKNKLKDIRSEITKINAKLRVNEKDQDMQKKLILVPVSRCPVCYEDIDPSLENVDKCVLCNKTINEKNIKSHEEIKKKLVLKRDKFNSDEEKFKELIKNDEENIKKLQKQINEITVPNNDIQRKIENILLLLTQSKNEFEVISKNRSEFITLNELKKNISDLEKEIEKLKPVKKALDEFLTFLESNITRTNGEERLKNKISEDIAQLTDLSTSSFEIKEFIPYYNGKEFSQLDPGTKLRISILYYFNLLKMGLIEEIPHPNLLILDSPNQQEINVDLHNIFSIIKNFVIENENKDFQIIISSASHTEELESYKIKPDFHNPTLHNEKLFT